MHTEQRLWTAQNGWTHNGKPLKEQADLVLYFGGKGLLDSGERYADIRNLYPDAEILGCSTGGEIMNGSVNDNTVALVAISFKSTTLRSVSISVDSKDDSYSAGKQLAEVLNSDRLSNIFLLSDGTHINGSDVVRGLYNVLDKDVIVTGGLAGDAADFEKTFVGLNESPQTRTIAAVGFYGDAIHVGHGTMGGWRSFGPQRSVTRSEGNVLYEIDHQPALELYKKYLGDEAANLPGSALLYPLCIRPDIGSQHEIVRTVVGIDEENNAMIFAGDIPTGYIAQFMQGDFESLVDGAFDAAEAATNNEPNQEPGLALLVSCVGRKIVLGQEISDEAEAVAEALGHAVPTIGFYSYGEISHQHTTGECSLHNQTMTVTTISEAV